jgi:hypothetical protein
MAEKTYISFYLRTSTIHVFNAALRKIGQPPFVRFMINPDTMQMAMIPANKKDFQSFRVPKGLYSNRAGNDAMKVHSQKLCRALASKLGWEVSQSYRVPGKVFEEQRVIRFDLCQASMIQKTSS